MQHSSSAGVLVAGTWLHNTPRVLLIQQMVQQLLQVWLLVRPALIWLCSSRWLHLPAHYFTLWLSCGPASLLLVYGCYGCRLLSWS